MKEKTIYKIFTILTILALTIFLIGIIKMQKDMDTYGYPNELLPRVQAIEWNYGNAPDGQTSWILQIDMPMPQQLKDTIKNHQWVIDVTGDTKTTTIFLLSELTDEQRWNVARSVMAFQNVIIESYTKRSDTLFQFAGLECDYFEGVAKESEFVIVQGNLIKRWVNSSTCNILLTQ